LCPAQTRRPKIDGENSGARRRHTPPEIDYQDIGEALFHGLRVDYTYVHPEVLAERCTVEGQKLILNQQGEPRGVQAC